MKLKELIKQNIDGRKVLLLFLLSNTVFATMVLFTIPTVTYFSKGMKLMDMSRSGYSPEYVNNLLSTLGDVGRHAYLFNQLPVDMFYPLISGVAYCLLIAYFLDKLGKLDGVLFYACLLPLFSGFFDYMENIGIIIMLNTYPNNSDLLTQITSMCTVVKTSIASGYFVGLIVLLLVWVYKRIVG